jgi:thymidylate synthase (FAD)
MTKVTKEQMPQLQKMHTTLKFGNPLTDAEFVNQLEAVDVQIVHAPTIEQFRKTIAVFLLNTWNDKIQTEFDEKDVDQTIDELFKYELLPTAMETIDITWSVNGMDMIDTTHLIRHRLFSFSAQVHGDRDMRDDRVMVKPTIMAQPEFYERYKSITEAARELYVDMVDSGKIHGLDARTIMPRNFEHFYMVRCNIKDLIGYCILRGDEQIQTTVDNIIAMKLWVEVLKLYPFLKDLVDFRKPDAFYQRQCAKGKTNIFPPNAKNDTFEWCEEQFYHNKGRDEYAGSDTYLRMREELLAQIDSVVKVHTHKLGA